MRVITKPVTCGTFLRPVPEVEGGEEPPLHPVHEVPPQVGGVPGGGNVGHQAELLTSLLPNLIIGLPNISSFVLRFKSFLFLYICISLIVHCLTLFSLIYHIYIVLRYIYYF